jgi:hypothetical protein
MLTFPSDTTALNLGLCVDGHLPFCVCSPENIIYRDNVGLQQYRRPLGIDGVSYINPDQTARYHINIPAKYSIIGRIGL